MKTYQVPGFCRFFTLAFVLFAASVRLSQAGVVINEFMASNNSSLDDQDGESSDWIEIYNDSPDSVNLAGWSLTDSESDLQKWIFPSVNLPPDGFLVVFASDKNRATAGAELHTNFKLGGDGGYLALVESDGATIAHAYPSYPAQRSNVSYGMESSSSASFRLDFNDSSGEVGSANTEQGFNTMNLNNNPAGFGGITVMITEVDAALSSRDRAVPIQTATLTQDQIYDDFIYADSSLAGAGMDILITGLEPNKNYLIKIWSIGVGGSPGDRTANWFETASGTTNIIRSNYVWNSLNPPINDGDSTFSATMPASDSGSLQIDGRHVGGVSSSVYINGLELTAESAAGESSGELRYFSPATPGSANGTGFLGLVANTEFSVGRGFYEAPFSVVITNATIGAEIRWTTNGAAPTANTGAVYPGPIDISDTTLLRAAAFLDGYLPSEVTTHSYLFLDSVLQQSATQPGYPTTWQGDYPADYGIDSRVVTLHSATIKDDLRSIPTLSIVTSHSDLWDDANGIYNHATSQGPSWERAASAELINGDGTTAFAVNCGIQMQGNASRDNGRTPKHSIRLLFKNQYGPTKLEYDWFSGGVSEFNSIVLRACFTDSWSTRYSDTAIIPGGKGTRYRPEDSLLLRDIWVKSSMRDMGWLSGRCTFVHLYLNGLYWGVYDPSERLDAEFFAAHLGGREEDWDVVRDFTELLDGSMDDWNQMMSLVNAGVTSEESFQAIAELVDIDNLIDFMFLHIYAEAEDWPHHNWYAAHRRANGTNGLPATKWIFLPWDQEIVLDQLVRRNRVNVSNPNTPAHIYAQLRAWPEFRRIFGDRIQKHLFHDGAMTASNNVARMQALATRIDRAIVGESARWGDARKSATPGNPATENTFTRDQWWIPELDKLYTNYFQTLNATNIARFAAAGLYPEISAPSFNQFGGDVPFGFSLTMSHTNASGTIYFTTDGSDPRDEGTEAIGVTAEAYDSPITINTVTMVRARVLSGGEWSALTEATFFPPGDLSKLVVTEVMYNPPDLGAIDGNNLEFLELKNIGTNTLNLSGLIFDGITFTFPQGTTLAPNQFFVLARNSANFAAKYPGVSVGGTYTGQLSNSGEMITLSTPSAAIVFSLTFANTAPWPVAADGSGFSMVPKNPGSSQASDDGTKWRASSQIGGSPGADDPAQTIPAIVINEIISHTDPPQKDSIEIFNPTAAAVNISGWFLTDNVDNPRKFKIPTGTTLAAGAYTYFDENDFNSGVGTNVNFAFSSVGESVYLFSADNNGQLTGYTHGFEFGPMFNGTNFGRYVNSVGEEFFLIEKSITLGSQNSGPRVGPIVMNEIHYHPETGGDEFVELLNVTGNAVPLFDPLVPTNTWEAGGIAFTFPTNITMAPAELLLLVSTNPAAFRAKYNVPESVRILGPFTGSLQNSGETLRLATPDTPNIDLVPYIVVEEVRYGDNSPWPPAADGGGFSLQRLSSATFGSEPTNWVASTPTPGRLFDPNDTDGDGMPNAFEMANGLNHLLDDADDDLDEDGVNNLEEYTNGTSPQIAQNYFQLGVSRNPSNANSIILDFYQLPGRDYVIEQSPTLSPPVWTSGFTLSNVTTAAPVRITNSISGSSSGFYKLIVTP